MLRVIGSSVSKAGRTAAARSLAITPHLYSSSADHLTPKSPSQSLARIVLDMDDPKTMQRFTNSYGGFRFGNLMCDLDSMAGASAYLHSDGFSAERPLTNVTVAIDKIQLHQPLNVRNYVVTSKVVKTGNSSMVCQLTVESLHDADEGDDEVPMVGDIASERKERAKARQQLEMQEQKEKEMESGDYRMHKINTHTTVPIEVGKEDGSFSSDSRVDGKKRKLALDALFTMVARHKDVNVAAKIPKLMVETKEEKEQEAVASNIQKRKRTILADTPPGEEEASLIHKIFKDSTARFQAQDVEPIARGRVHSSPNSNFGLPTIEGDDVPLVPISDTKLSSLQIMHRESQNVHGAVFGGFLCRDAYELAFTAVHLFTGVPPLQCLATDNITFLAPVNIGHVVRFTTFIPYNNPTEGTCSAAVRADVLNPSTGKRRTTNTFHFNFKIPKNSQGARVTPETYPEAVAYIKGRSFSLESNAARIASKQKEKDCILL